MADRSKYQEGIIRRYYENRDNLDFDKLSELVTELYLADSKKRRATLWERAAKIMERLGVPQSRIDHVVETAKPEILMAVVEDIRSGKIKPPEKKKPGKPGQPGQTGGPPEKK